MAEQRFTNRRVTGLAGLGTVILFGVGNALWAFDQPHGGASARDVMAFYASDSSSIVVGASLSLVSVALFVLFASGAREILREHEGGDLFAMAAFGGALLLVAAGLGAETINMAGALRAGDGSLTPQLGRALFEISYVLGYNAAGVGIGIMLAATAVISLRARPLMPAWAAVFMLVAGLAFTTPLARFLLAPSLLLLIVVSIQLLRPEKLTGSEGADKSGVSVP